MHGNRNWDPRIDRLRAFARGEGREAFGPWQGRGRPPVPPGPPGMPGAPPFGGPGMRGGGGRRSRRRKGDVREAVLALLAERPMHGYEMLAELEERTEGVWRPSPGSVYPTLQMLEDEGLVEGEKAEGKRMYALTDAGREHVEQRRGRPAPWEEVKDGISAAALNLRGEMASLTSAAHQVMMVGTHDQQARALEILADARRRLYGILAAEDTGTAPADEADEPDEPED